MYYGIPSTVYLYGATGQYLVNLSNFVVRILIFISLNETDEHKPTLPPQHLGKICTSLWCAHNYNMYIRHVVQFPSVCTCGG